MIPRLCAVLLFVLVLGACAPERSAGNSVETESDIAARLLPVDSILPEWNHPADSLTVVTLRFDRTNFDFSMTSADGSNLRLERIDGSLLAFEIVYWDSAAAIGRLRVRLDAFLLERNKEIRLRWNDSSATSLPDPVRTWEGIGNSQKLALNSVLVDDFESGSDTTLLPTRPLWETFADDSATILGFSFPDAGRGRSGKVVHLEYTSVGTWYALVKTPVIRGTIEPRSFRALDSIVLWARGSGKLIVAFDHLTNGVGPKAWITKSLDTNWVRYAIRPQDLDTADGIGGNAGWNAVRDSVTHVTFIVNRGTDLWLDDVRLHGIDLDDVR